MSAGLDVVMLSPGLPHHGGTLWERSLGGSETAAIRVAAALAKLGHRVSVFSPGHTGGVWDGVNYLPIEQFPAYVVAAPHDVTVISRAVEYYRLPVNSTLRVLWCHDLALKRNIANLAGVMWSVDAIYVVSEFMRQQYKTVNGALPESVYLRTRNGVDLASFAPLAGVPRDPQKLVYGSRPERGLETCLAVMAVLAQNASPLRLDVAWYDNVPPQLQNYYQALWQQAAKLPNVRLLGPLKQIDWHRELATAMAMIYPGCGGDFREVSCIAAIEAMACGTPVVTCAKGALPETLHPACAEFLGDETTEVGTPGYVGQFAGAVAKVVHDPNLWRSMSFAGRQRATMFDWDGVAEQWTAHWDELLAERRAGGDFRLRRQLARSGDGEGLAMMIPPRREMEEAA